LLLWLLFFGKAGCYSAVDLDTIVPCLIAAKLKGKKLVYDAHEYFTEVPEVINRPFVKKVWQTVEQFSIPRVDKAYTVSASLATLFERQYKVHFEVIRNVPVKNISANETSSEDYILYQGALNMGRAIEHYIRAMKNVNCKLSIAGEGDLSQMLRDMVKHEKLEDKVKFLGFLPPDELKKVTARAKIGLNCIENSGLSYRYSLSNRTFDFIMAGIPQIISDFPEYTQLNNEFDIAVVTKELKPESIALSINQLLSDKPLYERLKNNCIKAREVLNWESEEKKLLKIYE
jgi:glycosyltransferase involved in cell wall biosynthesis